MTDSNARSGSSDAREARPTFSTKELEELRKHGWSEFEAGCLLTDETSIASAPLAERVTRHRLRMDATEELTGMFEAINTLIANRIGDEERDHNMWAAVQGLCRRGMELMGSYEGLLDPGAMTVDDVKLVVQGPIS